MRGLMWFKDDLRTIDNTALIHASRHCDEGIAGIYFIDPSMWKKHDVAACRVEFVLAGLVELKNLLAKLNIPLIVKTIKHTTDIPKLLAEVMERDQFNGLFFNLQYEVNEHKRDTDVEKFIEKNHEVFTYHDQVILAPGSVLNGSQDYYKVFTPFKRAWFNVFREKNIQSFPAPRKQHPFKLKTSQGSIPKSLTDFTNDIDLSAWPAGEIAAMKRLRSFTKHDITEYEKQRDFPAIAGTSRLSAYLAAGFISPRQCFLAAYDANHHELDSGNKGVMTWLGELVWREFYKHILVAAPRVSMRMTYKREANNMPWNTDEALFKAWQQGQTGYPLIDAAMRQMHQTGWMHNRLRMVVAMFLSKNLFFDWRLGEKYFMENLIDGDLAANNGGWQWSASTGTDAVPYFRIFNPILQSKRFDPDGEFILEFCPELKGFDRRGIHEPYKANPELAQRAGYPRPIIDLNVNKAKLLTAFKALKTKTS